MNILGTSLIWCFIVWTNSWIGEGSVQVAETDQQQATLIMSSLRNVAHTFVNDVYTGNTTIDESEVK